MLNQHFALVHPTLQPQDPPALAAERILSNINAESLFFIGRNATTLSTGQSKHSLVHKFIVTGHQSSIPMEYQALECSVVDPTAAPAPRQSSQDALYSVVPGWDGNTTPFIRWPSLTNESKALLRHTCPKIAELIDRNPSTTATFDTNLSSPGIQHSSKNTRRRQEIEHGFLITAQFFFSSVWSEYPGNVETNLPCKGDLNDL